jgi:replicative DNA helicase
MGKRLHDIAKAADCGLIVIHHINRGSEHRENKEPQLSDLRDSGHLEQDSDVVVMPHRPDYWDVSENKPRYSETRLLVRKNREGDSGFGVSLYYDMLQQWFYARENLPPGAMIPTKVTLT